MEKLNIAILIGTTREARQSHKVAALIKSYGKKIDQLEIKLVDPKNFKFVGDGNDPEGKDPSYTTLTEWAEAFILVIPEYNHSFPGSLKRMLDSESTNYIHKPVAFAGVSSGGWGGVRAIESMVNVVRELGLIASFTDIHFPRVQDLFDENGNLINYGSYDDRLKRFFDELIWLTKVLKAGRSADSSYQ